MYLCFFLTRFGSHVGDIPSLWYRHPLAKKIYIQTKLYTIFFELTVQVWERYKVFGGRGKPNDGVNQSLKTLFVEQFQHYFCPRSYNTYCDEKIYLAAIIHTINNVFLLKPIIICKILKYSEFFLLLSFIYSINSIIYL